MRNEPFGAGVVMLKITNNILFLIVKQGDKSDSYPEISHYILCIHFSSSTITHQSHLKDVDGIDKKILSFQK